MRTHRALALPLVLPLLTAAGCTFEIHPAAPAPAPAEATAPADEAPAVEGFDAVPATEVPDLEPPVELPADEPEAGEPEPAPADWTTPAWPEQVLEPAVALTAGAAHVCALSGAGDVSCWGRNDVGQLGYGHTDAIGDDEPAASHGVVDVGGPVVSLVAGRQHTCAILAKGSIRCWGYGGDLALGNGNGKYYTVGDDETPGELGDAIVYASSPFRELAAGDHHTCVRTDSGATKCWGTSPVGALGYGYATQTGGWLGNVPMGDLATSVVAGGQHTCTIVEGGAVRCWGEAACVGQGGEADLGDDEYPSSVSAAWLGEPVTQLAAGDAHTCALTASGAVRCWGVGDLGVLGYASEADVLVAEAAGVVNTGGAAVRVAAGQSHTCALLLGGAVRCWGDGTAGALGYGDTADVGDDEAPAAAGPVPLSRPALDVVAGDAFTCALLDTGAVQCWGSGLDGRLGYGHEADVGDDEVPADVQSILPFGH